MIDWINRVGAGFWCSFIVAVIASPVIMALLRLTKSRQTISAHAPSTHQAKQGTPTMGGLIIVTGGIAGEFLGYLRATDDSIRQTLVAGLVLLVGYAVIGFVDDFLVPRFLQGKRGLGWKQKIVMQFLVGVAAIATLKVGWGAQAATLLFSILFFSNAYNFSDGLDGLAGTLLIGFAVGLGGLALNGVGSEAGLQLVAPLVAGVIVFLYYNAPPARVFMGDVGSLPIGAVLGLAVGLAAWPVGSSGPKTDSTCVALAVLSFMMIVELVPVPLQIFSVKVFKRRLFPFTPIHHAFEKAGWAESRVVYTFALTQLVCSLIATSIHAG